MKVAERKGLRGKAIATTKGPKHHFFGYYEKCPWDITGRYLLGLETDFMDRPPTPDTAATVGVIDLKDANRWRAIGRTRAWNWQQGCMLQWLGDSSQDPKHVIYNDVKDGRAVAVIQSINDGEKRVLPQPIYGVSLDGKWGLGLNFGRLHQVRPGYGYCGLQDQRRDELAPRDDGIYMMDLMSGDSRLILSIEDVVGFAHESDMDGKVHWFNHLQFSPDGSRFSFLHRWMEVNAVNREVAANHSSAPAALRRSMWRYMRETVFSLKATAIGGLVQRIQDRYWHPKQEFMTRMFTASRDGSNLNRISSDGFVSHSDWRNNQQVLAWATKKGLGEKFFLFTCGSGEIDVVGEGTLTNDGHCTYSPDGRWILTDSGPNVRNMSTLILYDTVTEDRKDIYQVFSPPELRGEIRCDLHPRWSRDGRQICFDSAHEGQRQIYILDIDPWLSDKKA